MIMVTDRPLRRPTVWFGGVFAALALLGSVLCAGQALAGETVEVVAPVVTRHETTIRGQRIAYTATAGETLLRNDRDEPIATIYSFA
ncbi:MAG: hypothetical protein ACK46X_22555, partial [Candidatus Sericytochromatia bacterium]